MLSVLSIIIIDNNYSWCERNRDFLNMRGSSLEFFLHRSQFMRLLLASNPPNSMLALAYAQDKFVPLVTKYGENIYRLLACLAYVPLSRLQSSPYADLASPSLHLELEPMFATEYCASLGMSRQVPLRVVCNIGGGGALARIEKGRKVMRERKSEWSQTDELPVCASTCFPIRRNTHFLHRLKYRYLQRIGITQYSPAPYRRSRQQTQTHR